MLALLHFLLHGHWPCHHKWVIYKENPIEIYTKTDGKTVTNNGTHFTLRCEKCGKLSSYVNV